MLMSLAAMESSRTHFDILGLGLEASSRRKLTCPRLEDSTIFCTMEILLENARNFAKNLRRSFLFSAIEDCLKIFLLILLIGSGASESATVR